MRTFLFIRGLMTASLFSSAAAAGERSDYALRPVAGGGYAIERKAAPDSVKKALGLASIAELAPLLAADAAAPEKVDFTAGKKLDGVFTVLVGRDDGTLGKYEGASDVVIFAAQSTLSEVGDVTTLSGAVVFAIKIDNAGAPAAVQRFEAGTIALTRASKSL